MASSSHVASYYAATCPSRESFAPLRAKRECDVCIVGGGLAGLTTAYEVAKSGKSVVLLEAERIAWGASGRNGGFVSSGYAGSLEQVERKLGLAHARELSDLAIGGADYLRQNIQSLGLPDVLISEGILRLQRYPAPDKLKRYRDEVEEKYGETLDFWNLEKVHALLRSNRYFAGLHKKSGFTIHPLRYAEGLAEAARKCGAEIHEETKALGAVRDKGVWIVRSGEGEVRAPHLVYSASAYGIAGKLSKALERALLPIATYMVASRPHAALDEIIAFPGGIGDGRRAGDYYRKGPNGRLLWGGRITTRTSEPQKLAKLLKGDIVSVYPDLKDLEIEYAWSGLMGYARHLMPIIGEIEPGLWAATAFGGHGLNTTAMAGNLIAGAIVEGDDRWKLFAPFGAPWAGGKLGLIATQLEYWRLQALDRWDERARAAA